MSRKNSENTRVNSEVLDNARSYCFGTGRILQKFIDTAITNELSRCNLKAELGIVEATKPEEEMQGMVHTGVTTSSSGVEEVKKGNGW